MKKKLAEIAHSRAGDKGNTLVLSLFPLDEKDFELLEREVTPERVQNFLKHQLKGPIVRHSLPSLKALLFTCENALNTGVTTSLSLDAHGKSLSFALLEFELEV